MSESRPKPKLRGVPDVIATLMAVPACWAIVEHAHPGKSAIAALVYGVSLIGLFFASALYHTPMWPDRVRGWLKRFDHSMIYVLIAGSYTPICLLLLPEDEGHVMLGVVWAIAALGTLKSVFWPTAPRSLNAAVYVVMGWLIAPYGGPLYDFSPAAFWLALSGGLFYTVGALIYAKKLLDLWPRWLGYHEAFHFLVILAAATHYIIFWDLVALPV